MPSESSSSPHPLHSRPRPQMSYMMQPQIILLKEGTDTSQGKAQLVSNINACMVGTMACVGCCRKVWVGGCMGGWISDGLICLSSTVD